MIKRNKVIRYKYRPHNIKNNEYMDECKLKKETVFILPDDLGDKFKLPEKFNDEWLKTATLEDKINFFNEFLSRLDDNSNNQKPYVKIVSMKKIINKLFEKLGYVPKIDCNKIDFNQKYRIFKLDGITCIDLVTETGNTLRIQSELLQFLGYEYAILCANELCDMLNAKY